LDTDRADKTTWISERAERAEFFMKDRKVLVCDDESHVTNILSFKLQSAGARVTVACDGEEAFAMACEQVPDLIITDFEMPHLSGYEMAVKLRRNAATANIPLVMLTARGHRLSPQELAETNIRHLAAKPFSARDLVTKATQILEGATVTGA
jgi:two-component system, OmpR family, alkaline phosphatase synthesis response regulator PhoP